MTSATPRLGLAIVWLACLVARAGAADDVVVGDGCAPRATRDRPTPAAARPRLRLQDEGRRVSGRVVGPDGRAAAGVEVAVLHPGRVGDEVASRATTDARGAFTLVARHHDDDWEGACVLLRAEGGPPVWATASRRGTDAEILLPRRCRLRGRLGLDDGTPAAGTRVTALVDAGACALGEAHELALREPDAIADARGCFELAAPVGAARLRLHLEHPLHLSIRTVAVPAAGRTWTATLARDATLEVALDRPLPAGWTLRLARDGAPVDAAGRAVRDGTLLEGRAVLAFAHVLPGPGYRLLVDDGAGERPVGAPFPLDAGTAREAVALPAPRPWRPGTSWVVAVELLDASGTRLDPPAWRARFGVTPPALSLTDARGRRGLAVAGDRGWRMPGTWTPPVSVALGERDLGGVAPGDVVRFVVDEQAHADATGTLVLRGPAPDARLVVSLRRGGRGRPLVVRNATTLPGLAPGRWAVTARGDGCAPLRTVVEIEAGRTRRLDVPRVE